LRQKPLTLLTRCVTSLAPIEEAELMAKNKTGKNEAAHAQKKAVEVTTEVPAAEAVTAETVATAKASEEVKAETPVAEQVVDAVAGKVSAAAEAVTEEAVKAEAVVTEAAGQVASFVKVQLEQAQRHFGQLESEAQKALQTLVSRGRESGREVLQRLNVNELRGNPTVQKLEKQATWVGGEVRQCLGLLQDRMVKVVGGVASQSRVEAINRELDRLTRKIDSLVSPRKPEQPEQPR
jgi:hypothetical protein